jgi:hypothetical protein
LRWSPAYRELVRRRARELDSDGCSGVPDFYRDACLEHDIHYRTGRTLSGVPLTRAKADAIFRKRIQQMSVLGVLSPVALWRWAGVRLFGGSSWQGAKEPVTA